MKTATYKPKVGWRALKWCLRLLLISFLLLILLAVTGVPGSWMSWVLGPADNDAFQIEAEEWRYRPGTGLRVKGLAVYSPLDRVSPLFKAEEMFFQPDGMQWIRQRQLEGGLRLGEGKFETNLGMWTKDLTTDQMLTVDRMGGRISLEAGSITFHEFKGSLPNFDLMLSGQLQLEQETADPDDGTIGTMQNLASTAKTVAQALKILENFRFEHSPLLRFELLPGPLLDLKMMLDYEGAATHRGFAFVEMRVDAEYREGQLEVKHFLIQENAERSLAGRVEINFSEETFMVELKNTLRRFGLEALSPFALDKLLDSLQLRVEDRCDFDLKIGPNTFAHPGNIIQGNFDVENAFYRDTFFPEISLELDLNLPALELKEIKGIVGQSEKQGPFTGDFSCNFNDGKVTLNIVGAFYPDKAISLVGASAERQLRDWEFRKAPPAFEVYFLQEKKGGEVTLRVEASGEDVLWRGTSFDRISTRVNYENSILKIQDAQAERGKEYFNGDFSFAPGFKNCEFNFSSRFYLPDLLQLIGPSVTKFTQPFRFRGDCAMDAEGFVDLSGKHAHKVKGTFAFNDLVYQWLSLNALAGSVNLADGLLEIPDLHAEVEGGTLAADFKARQPFQAEGSFALTLDLNNMDLHKVILKATDLEDTPYKGLLGLDLELKGNLQNTEAMPRTDSYTGGGRLEIKEGALFRIPLMLGLSELLSRLVSGFGYASQSDFSSDFEIAGGKITSKELSLQGNILSIAGPGSYRFADHKISADLKIHLLNEGVLSDALKVILWPIRKLIEVQLTGTLENPDWQPKNLPKEIFGK